MADEVHTFKGVCCDPIKVIWDPARKWVYRGWLSKHMSYINDKTSCPGDIGTSVESGQGSRVGKYMVEYMVGGDSQVHPTETRLSRKDPSLLAV